MMRRFVPVLLSALLVLAGCANDNPEPEKGSLNISEAFHGDWTGAMDLVRITADGIVVRSGNYEKTFPSINAINSDNLYETCNGGRYYAMAEIDDPLYEGREQLEISIEPYNNGIILGINENGADGNFIYMAASYLIPLEDVKAADNLEVPAGYDGDYQMDGNSGYIRDGNIAFWVYGVYETVDVGSKLANNNGRIIHQSYDSSQRVYDLIFEYEEEGREYRLAWSISLWDNGRLRLLYSTWINDLHVAQGALTYEFVYKPDGQGLSIPAVLFVRSCQQGN